MSQARVCAWIAALAAVVAAPACSSSDKPDASGSSTTTSASAEAVRRVIVSGTATLDSQPVNSRWVGAVVLDDGLATPCQTALPPVAKGRYSVSVFTEAASAGCGRPGAEIALWIYANDKIVYSTDTVAWPEAGSTATFDATYDTANPGGAAPVVAQFQGGVTDADGEAAPSGTRVEAYVGDTLCGVAGVRNSQDFNGYILSVVGPDSIEGCTRGARIAFRIDGEPTAPTTAVNTPPGEHDSLDLRVA